MRVTVPLITFFKINYTLLLFPVALIANQGRHQWGNSGGTGLPTKFVGKTTLCW